MRGATCVSTNSNRYRSISIHAPHAGRDGRLASTLFAENISIHAPHAGRDGRCHHVPHPALRISIHAPHAGRDPPEPCRPRQPQNFNPRAPCGARRSAGDRAVPPPYFNPRAPCGARRQNGSNSDSFSIFQSTRPMRGATQFGRYYACVCYYFNPRAPCGARQQKYTKLLYTLLRQKAILRQFHAKRRLLKRFSTYKYRNTFLICSANRMGKICTLPLRTTRSLDLPEGMSACSQSARFCFRTFFPSSKTAGYPSPDP